MVHRRRRRRSRRMIYRRDYLCSSFVDARKKKSTINLFEIFVQYLINQYNYVVITFVNLDQQRRVDLTSFLPIADDETHF